MPEPTEAQTRKDLIDPALKKAGWDVRNPDLVRIEIPVDGFDPAAWQALEARLRRLKDAGVPYDAQSPKGISDYALQRQFAHIVHKVERLRAQQREALRQAEHLFQTLLHRAFQGAL